MPHHQTEDTRIQALADRAEIEALHHEPGESVVFAWVAWPDKATCDAAWPKIEADPRMQAGNNPTPFDGKRLIYGGFQMVVDA